MLSFRPLDLPAHRPPRDKSLWPVDSELRCLSVIKYSYLWHSQKDGGYHMTPEELEPYRLLGDAEIDMLLMSLQDEGKPLGPSDDLMLLAENAMKVEKSERSESELRLCTFLEKYSTVPAWVDEAQLRRGQEVFLAYTPAASLSLYYRSLIAGFSIPKIAAVIRATGYLAPPSRPDQALQRLLDTGELTAACIGIGPKAILPGGFGWKTALYVRILHAKVRKALLSREGKNKWDVQKFGIPINQEDMSGTLLAFSVNVLDGIDLIAGVALTDAERRDYVALWRYIGWLLGVETQEVIRGADEPTSRELPPLDPCGPGQTVTKHDVSNERSVAILQSIMEHILDPDETSIEVAHHLLKISDRKPPTKKFSEIPDEFYKNSLFYLRAWNCRLLVGGPLADALQLPTQPNLWQYAKTWMFSSLTMCFLRIYTLLAMFIPHARRRMITLHANGLIKFHESWKESHKSKMARALSSKELPSSVEEETKDSNKRRNRQEKGQSMCPFAMVASPNQ